MEPFLEDVDVEEEERERLQREERLQYERIQREAIQKLEEDFQRAIRASLQAPVAVAAVAASAAASVVNVDRIPAPAAARGHNPGFGVGTINDLKDVKLEKNQEPSQAELNARWNATRFDNENDDDDWGDELSRTGGRMTSNNIKKWKLNAKGPRTLDCKF